MKKRKASDLLQEGDVFIITDEPDADHGHVYVFNGMDAGHCLLYEIGGNNGHVAVLPSDLLSYKKLFSLKERGSMPEFDKLRYGALEHLRQNSQHIRDAADLEKRADFDMKLTDKEYLEISEKFPENHHFRRAVYHAPKDLVKPGELIVRVSDFNFAQLVPELDFDRSAPTTIYEEFLGPELTKEQAEIIIQRYAEVGINMRCLEIYIGKPVNSVNCDKSRPGRVGNGLAAHIVDNKDPDIPYERFDSLRAAQARVRDISARLSA